MTVQDLLEEKLNNQYFSDNQIAMIKAQCKGEAASALIMNFDDPHLKDKLQESFAYKCETLCDIFGKYFPRLLDAENALKKGKEFIANTVYANRLGNGNFESGDGWRYRGRGLIQLTGKENYVLAGLALDLPLEDNPDLLLEVDSAINSAIWFITNKKGFLEAANRGDVVECTELVNGGKNGLKERQIAFNEFGGKLVG